MAKISDRDDGRRDGGYTRIFNNEDLGALLSEVHATSISAGTELEKMVFINNITDFDDFIDNIPSETGVYIANKPTIKKSKKYRTDKNEPDGIIFILDESMRKCNIIELKDGDTFDTKKVDGEVEALKAFLSNIAPKIQFVVNYFICGFNSKDKESLKVGLKGRIDTDHLMTGKELCDLIEIDYDEIINKRKEDAEANMTYFIDRLLDIEEIKKRIKEKLGIE
jgi:hypothetical protein